MDFAMAMKYIDEKNKLGIVPGLDNIKELLRRLGNPQDRCKCLHIAGTNGKGSIFSFVQEILIEGGYSVGRYISPTIISYLERFQINKKYMSEDQFTEYLEKVAKVVKDMVDEGLKSPTAFEIETAVAFLYFLERNVDYVLVECGMGGRLDATNVIRNPIMSVMASISMDHMQFLGDTLELIAKEKAAIIKNDSLCVCAPQEEIVAEIIKKTTREQNSKLVLCDKDAIAIENMSLEKTDFIYKNKKYSITLLGEHQILNAITAIEVAEQLGVEEANIVTGLMKTTWMGRMSRVHDEPPIYVDGAHNKNAWLSLREAVNKYFTNNRIIYIIGVLEDKEYTKMIDILQDTMAMAITITPQNKRALSKEMLAECISGRGIPVITADSPEYAIQNAMENADENTVIVVCGSLSFINDYLDETNINLWIGKYKDGQN